MKVQKRLKSLFYVKKFEKFVSSRQPTNNTFTEVNFVPLVFQYTCGPKKVINLVSKKTKAPVSFPFLLTKKSLSKKVNIIIQQQHPTQFRYQKNQVFFRFSHDTAPPLSSQNSNNPFMCCLSKSIQRSRSFYNAPAHLAGLFFNLHNVRFILIALIKEN